MIRVLLVDDEEFWRSSLKQYLTQEADIYVVGAVATEEEALQVVRLLDIDVAVVDLMLRPGEWSGLEVAEDILYERPDIRIIVLTSLAEREAIIHSFALGAANYIEKTAYRDLPDAIRAAHANSSPVHPSAAEVLREEFRRIVHTERAGILTKAEKEILQLIHQGLTQREIQDTLRVTRNTVKNHITNIQRKLGTKTSKEAASLAAKRKWLS